jgi:CRISPR/Cas system-associated exonuclease Cas4 (RecB family)
MDDRIEAFLRDVLALEGENSNRIREGVRVHLARYEKEFPDIKRASYRERVVEEIARQKETPTERHLRIVLEAIDGPAHFLVEDD